MASSPSLPTPYGTATSSHDGFDAELDELRALRDNTGQFLVDLEAREKARTGINNLRVEYNRVHGFYIEVTHGQTTKVPDDYRRRQTLKNAERYITPELKSFEDKALSARERALAREKVLYEQIVARRRAVRDAAAELRQLRSRRSTHYLHSQSTRNSRAGCARSSSTAPQIEIRGGTSRGRRARTARPTYRTTAHCDPVAACL